MAKTVGQNNSRSAKNINLMLRYLEKAEDYGLFCSTCPAAGKHRSRRQGCGDETGYIRPFPGHIHGYRLV